MVVVGPVPAESREFRFQLFDVLGVGAVVAWPRYQQHSVASLQAIVETFASLASGHRRPALNQVEALAQGADMVMTQGATQSNHARQTAAAAANSCRASANCVTTAPPRPPAGSTPAAGPRTAT